MYSILIDMIEGLRNDLILAETRGLLCLVLHVYDRFFKIHLKFDNTT